MEASAAANANAGGSGGQNPQPQNNVQQEIVLTDDELIESWLFSKATSTQKGYANRVKEWRRWLRTRSVPMKMARLHHAQAFANVLRARGIIARPTLAILKSLYRWMAAQGHTNKNSLANLKLGSQQTAKRERKLSRQEVRKLIETAQNMPRRPKMYTVLVKLGIYSGLRRAEMAKLNTDDISLHPNGSVSVLVRFGKGGKTRRVTLAKTFGKELLAYAKERGAGASVFNATAPTIGNRISNVAAHAG